MKIKNVWAGVAQGTVAVLMLAGLTSCKQENHQLQEDNDGMDEQSVILKSSEQVSRLIPARVKDRAGWAADMSRIMDELGVSKTKENVCSVIAIVDQESNFDANPVVPDLGVKAIKAFQTEVPQKFMRQFGATLGPAVARYFDYVLKNEPSINNSFLEQIKGVKTEQELDLIYRQIFDYVAKQFYADSLTNAAAKFIGKDISEDNNPITTIGSMQVLVQYARDHQRDHMSVNELRDYLYTREGGLYYGIHRLMKYPADYDKEIYRFADYNSGMYSSRNAAVQQDLSKLLNMDIALDGDLLSYDKSGHALEAPSQTEAAINQLFADHHMALKPEKIRADLLKEKESDFEKTDTYIQVLSIYEQQMGKMPPYAIMPQVAIIGPKLKHEYNTNWYADNVNRRFEACMSRGRHHRKR